MAFVVFEGLDGSGKTSLMQRLEKNLTQSGIQLVMTREPGGTELGEELRKVLLRVDGDTPTPECELLLYEAIRAQHVQKVLKPALKNKKWILCDRYTAATVAFQSAGRSLDTQLIDWLNEFATNGLKPDLTVLLDLPVSVSLERRKKRVDSTGVEEDRFEKEKMEFHEKVRQSYLEQAKKDSSWLVIDATQTPDEVHAQLLQKLKSKKWL